MADLLPAPPSLRIMERYIKVGVEISRRDPVVSYFCNFYALQAGMKTNYKANPEAKKFLFTFMDKIEEQKKVLKANPEYNEAISEDIAGQALVEAVAMKLFFWADGQDRTGVFNKHVVKSFYTASILFDVLEAFEEPISDEAKTHRKYAQWKATYIHNCLKNNEKPVPGPIGGLEHPDDIQHQVDEPTTSTTSYNDAQGFPGGSSQSEIPETSAKPQPAPRSAVSQQPEASSSYDDPSVSSPNSTLSHEDFRDAEKLCKYAASALQYEDVSTAINNLEKCLRLLRSGQQ
ncbi:vacuolar protein sorting-associated protein VTA1 homolog [Clavelina lepadiformis]|uniref:vacuolar protein sorting-associated protein VTA1 homolog n=1 Tax=Clavelina lepadiformis TaxID=159417 RepID=UPI0040416DDF